METGAISGDQRVGHPVPMPPATNQNVPRRTRLPARRVSPRRQQCSTHDTHNRRSRRMPAFGLISLEFREHRPDAFRVETRSDGVQSPRAATTNRTDVTQEFSGPLRVTAYSFRAAFTDLHASGSKADEPLHKSGFRSGPTKSVPERFPNLVGFPIEPAIEKIQGVEPLRVGGEDCGKGSTPGCGLAWQSGEHVGRDRAIVACAAMQMPTRVGHRVGQVVARNEAIGRKRSRRSGAAGTILSHGSGGVRPVCQRRYSLLRPCTERRSWQHPCHLLP
jgi:hypothetical protein